MVPIELKNCNFFLIDGTGSNFITIRIAEGALNYSTKKDIQERKSRGNLWQLREGEEQCGEVNFQFVWNLITSSSPEPSTIEEVLYGQAPGWTNASPDPYGPFTVNIQVVNRIPCYGISGGFITETHNFPEFAFGNLDHALKESSVDCKGIYNRTKPIIVRS